MVWSHPGICGQVADAQCLVVLLPRLLSPCNVGIGQHKRKCPRDLPPLPAEGLDSEVLLS